ncbi:MAG: phosphate ABC transporter ATP-binding protein PstB [bacterium]
MTTTKAAIATRARGSEAKMSEPETTTLPAILETRDLTFRYGQTAAVKKISISIFENRITSIIGPSGCGKSTLLRTFNRMNDFIADATIEGEVLYHGTNLYAKDIDPVEVRRRIGMVFQRPNPFPKSIFQNVAWGPTINGYGGKNAKRSLEELVERSLRQAGLWDEVKDRLDKGGLALSGGQQQRLCIARALALQPEIILMDEPCSALDPASTARIEDLLFELAERYTIVIVTHNMQQAARVSDFTAFLDTGTLIEFGVTDQVFTRPKEKRTEDYVTGRFG